MRDNPSFITKEYSHNVFTPFDALEKMQKMIGKHPKKHNIMKYAFLKRKGKKQVAKITISTVFV